MSKKELKGSSINIVNVNRFLYGYGDPDALNICSKQLKEMFEAAKPRLNDKIGAAMLYGTGGDSDSNCLKQIFESAKSSDDKNCS